MKSSRRQPLPSLLALLTVIGVLSIAAVLTLPTEVERFVQPTLAAILVFLVFTVLLQWRVGENLFGELGFLYLGFATAYTVLPAFALMLGTISEGDILKLLTSRPSELAAHLWRHVLFMSGVATGYLLLRGRESPRKIMISDPKRRDTITIIFLVAIIAICIFSIIFLSAPVETYYDHYTRFDDLSWPVRKLVSLFLRLKLGLYAALIVFLFLSYKRYKLFIPFVVGLIALHEMAYSFGSRIEAMIIFLQTIVLYNYAVKRITLKQGLLTCIALVAIFSFVELLRSLEFDLSSARESIARQGFKVASEFGAVFLTGSHLYAERAAGSLPFTEWPMFFSDFISMVTFGDFTRWNPMEWYARAYYPDAIVAPFTLGPIANSAIWGGEWDLVARSLLNGMFFAYIVRWFISHQDRWWAVTVYVYVYATCVMTLKYGIFWHLTPLVKTLLPTVILVWLVRTLNIRTQRPELSRSRRVVSDGGGRDASQDYAEANRSRSTTTRGRDFKN